MDDKVSKIEVAKALKAIRDVLSSQDTYESIERIVLADTKIEKEGYAVIGALMSKLSSLHLSDLFNSHQAYFRIYDDYESTPYAYHSD